MLCSGMQSMLYNLVSTTLSKHRACKQALHAKRMCDNKCLCNLSYATYAVRPRLCNLGYAATCVWSCSDPAYSWPYGPHRRHFPAANCAIIRSKYDNQSFQQIQLCLVIVIHHHHQHEVIYDCSAAPHSQMLLSPALCAH